MKEEEKNEEVLEPKPMTDQEKEDILSMDEVMTYFIIDECGAFLKYVITSSIERMR